MSLIRSSKCKSALRLTSGHAGKLIKCGGCGSHLRVPATIPDNPAPVVPPHADQPAQSETDSETEWFAINCPACGVRLQVETEDIGTKAPCPECRTPFLVPSSPEWFGRRPKERELNDGEVSDGGVSPEEQVKEKTPTEAIKNEDAPGNSLQSFETWADAAINRRELDSESRGTETAPAGRIPPLWQKLGFGFRLQGERGQNIETGSLIKDHVLILFFVPVFALGAYRCVDSPDSKDWIILGREPLTRLCRLCNIALLLLIPVSISLFGWNQYRNSPGGLSSHAMAKAKLAAGSNRYEQALSIYQKVIDEKWPDKDEAASELEAVFEQAFENSGSGQIISLMKFAAGSENQTLQNLSIEKGKQALHRLEDTDLAGAASILELLCENESLKQELLPRRVAIYQKIIDAEPKNGAALRLLAEALYESKAYAGMLALVEPFGNLFLPQDPISLQLGEACLKTGRHRDAIRYLSGYVGPKIMQLSEAEAGLAFHTKRIQKAVQQNLNRESGSQFIIGDETETDTESEQRYTSQVREVMQRDPDYQKALARFREASEVVTHAFTLGVTQLHYALTLPPGDTRRRQLEDAEKTFVILANKLGGNREYLLSLGQVQYQLGKSEEAKALFDRILELDNRSAESLLLVGKTMRDLGERNAAVQSFEEAWQKSEKPEEKHSAALLLANTVENPGRILHWLELCDQEAVDVQIRLATIKARIAKAAGNKPGAVRHMREAVAGLIKKDGDPITLNNRSLAYQELFRLTGDPSDREKANQEMARALELDPNAGIIVSNALSILTETAIINVLANRFDLRKTGGEYSEKMLDMLYSNEDELQSIIQQIKDMPEIQKARPLTDRVRAIAPRSPDSWFKSYNYFALLRDYDQMARIANSINGLELDRTDRTDHTRAVWASRKDMVALSALQAIVEQTELQLSKFPPESIEHRYFTLVRADAGVGLSFYDQPDDLETHLAKVQKIREQFPCYLADTTAQALCLSIADKELISEPGYKEMYLATSRSLQPISRICWALLPDNLKAELQENHYIKQAAEISLEIASTYKNVVSIYDWITIHAINPGKVKQDLIDKQRRSQIRSEIEFQRVLNPLKGDLAVEECLLLLYEGDDEGARKVIAKAKEMGIPLP
ncbi:MAG: hypothetical protein P1V20_24955 [Verrucomicrobiales bacterium]|nr:hypothetical protein [Verrucomicrobiales bacterium]